MVTKPMDLIQNSLKKRVKVRTRDGREFTGKLESFDESLNLVLKEAEELTEGDPKKRGTMVIKGGNTVYLNRI